MELASVVECDVQTVCDAIPEDMGKWTEDLSQNEEPITPKTSYDYIPFCAEGINTPQK